MIYFIRDVSSGSIKIGYTADAASVRLSALQSGNPHELELIGVVDGDRQREAEVHRLFEADRLPGFRAGEGRRREWFYPSLDLLSYIAARVGLKAVSFRAVRYVPVARGEDLADGDIVKLVVPTFFGGWKGLLRVIDATDRGVFGERLDADPKSPGSGWVDACLHEVRKQVDAGIEEAAP